MTARLSDQGGHGVHRWVWVCNRCAAIWSCVLTYEDPLTPTIATAVAALARLAGWDVAGDASPRARCPKCSRHHKP